MRHLIATLSSLIQPPHAVAQDGGITLVALR